MGFVCLRACLWKKTTKKKKPIEVMAVTAESGYMRVVHAGQLALALYPLSSSL